MVNLPFPLPHACLFLSLDFKDSDTSQQTNRQTLMQRSHVKKHLKFDLLPLWLPCVVNCPVPLCWMLMAFLWSSLDPWGAPGATVPVMEPEAPMWEPDMVIMSSGISEPASFRQWCLKRKGLRLTDWNGWFSHTDPEGPLWMAVGTWEPVALSFSLIQSET